ncbi:MAG: LEA type 2 family protein [Methanomicrobium sp.]|nr:LEA type 2 family protein [Methanomicrobium sp.]
MTENIAENITKEIAKTEMTDNPDLTENTEKTPAVEIRDIHFKGITASQIAVGVSVAVKNPMPVAVSLKKIEFTLYRIANEGDAEKDEYLGEGMRGDVRLAPSSETIIDIDVSLVNAALLSAAAEFLTGDVTVKVAGNVSFDLKIFAPAVHFEETKKVNGLPSMLFNEN